MRHEWFPTLTRRCVPSIQHRGREQKNMNHEHRDIEGLEGPNLESDITETCFLQEEKNGLTNALLSADIVWQIFKQKRAKSTRSSPVAAESREIVTQVLDNAKSAPKLRLNNKRKKALTIVLVSCLSNLPFTWSGLSLVSAERKRKSSRLINCV